MTTQRYSTLAGDRLPVEVRAVSRQPAATGAAGWIELGDLRPGDAVICADGEERVEIRAIHKARMPVFELIFIHRVGQAARERRMTPGQRDLHRYRSRIMVGAHQALAHDFPSALNIEDGLQYATPAELLRTRGAAPRIIFPATAHALANGVSVTSDGYSHLDSIMPRGIRDVIWLELACPWHSAFVITRSGILLPALGLADTADSPVTVETRPNGSSGRARRKVPDGAVAADMTSDAENGRAEPCVGSLTLAGSLMDGVDAGLSADGAADAAEEAALRSDPVAKPAVVPKRKTVPPSRKSKKSPAPATQKRLDAEKRARLAAERQARAAATSYRALGAGL